ncbi:MAG TPA: lipopolysaccharide transport periplasmic protein LptA [Rhodocyclaceae bacterium]
MSLSVFAVPAAIAERADRDQAVNLEADRITIDDARKVHVFEGNVRLSQGSLRIQAARIVVSQDASGFQRGTAEGTPARFEQKREGRDEVVSGQATRIEYDAHSERVEFFGQAVVRSGSDEIRGEYIGYDAREERYFAEARQPDGATATTGRVRATIQPRRQTAEDSPAPTDPSLSLQPAGTLAPESKDKEKRQ